MGWDKEVSEEIRNKFINWLKSLRTIEVPRTVAPYLEDISLIVLHHFMDASNKGVAGQTVAIVAQPSGSTQLLLTSKARIAKRGLSIARQELVACQMDANLAVNVNNALKGWPIAANYCWTDSQVALCWVSRPYKNWKTFVANRVKKIKEVTEVFDLQWRHVPTQMNHADLGSRGVSQDRLEKEGWWEGPTWLRDESKWPNQDEDIGQEQDSAEEVNKEIKPQAEKLFLITDERRVIEVDRLLERKSLQGTKRVIGWVFRFCNNKAEKKGQKDIRPIEDRGGGKGKLVFDKGSPGNCEPRE
eukprot:gene10671-11804_t